MSTRHNLPSRPYCRLIGREAELATIQSRIDARSRDWIVAIEGTGGLGKTALALEAGWRCVEQAPHAPPDERFAAVIWATAKREALTSRGITPVTPTLTSLDDLFVAIARVLGEPQALRAPRHERWRAAWHTLEHAGRVLLVLDNLEDVDDPDLLVFLRDMPGRIKTVATLRFHEDLPDPVQLGPLSQPAIAQLIHEECASSNAPLTQDQREYLAQAARGLPLVAQWVVGLAADRGAAEALEHLHNATGDLPRYLFGRIIERLRGAYPNAYLALLACMFFDETAGADAPALTHTLGLSDEQGREALRTLSQFRVGALGPSGRFTLAPIVYNYVTERAKIEGAAPAEWERGARARWVAFYEELAWRVDDATMHTRLQNEAPNVLHVLEWLRRHAAERDSASHLALLFGQFQDLLFDEGRWDKLQSYANALVSYVESAAGESAPDANAFTSDILVSVLQTPIDVYSRRAEYDEGARWLRRVGGLARKPTEWLKAELLLADARLKYNDGTMGTAPKLKVARKLKTDAEVKAYLMTLVYEATDCVDRALAILRSANRPDRVIPAHMTLANCYRAVDRFQVAERHYEETLHELEVELARRDPGSQRAKLGRWEAVIRGNLALMKGRQGRYVDACADLRAALPRLIETTDLIETYAALALYEFIRGNADDALALRARADTLKAQLREPEELSLCREEEQWREREARQRDYWRERMAGS